VKEINNYCGENQESIDIFSLNNNLPVPQTCKAGTKKEIKYLTPTRTSRKQKGPGLSGKLQITNKKNNSHFGLKRKKF
jgi:hypothetical protein